MKRTVTSAVLSTAIVGRIARFKMHKNDNSNPTPTMFARKPRSSLNGRDIKNLSAPCAQHPNATATS